MADNSDEPRRKSEWALLGAAAAIWLAGWLIYSGLPGPNLLSGLGGARAYGGKLDSKPWAGLVGLVLLSPIGLIAFRARRRLRWNLAGLILAGFASVYIGALVVFWTQVAPAVWGPYRYAYSAAAVGETACWKQVPGTANLPTGDVLAMSGSSASDLWGVGQDGWTSGSLTVHWDGRTLRTIASPANEPLYAVSSVSLSDAWAAGGDTHTSVEHWNGKGWHITPTPSLRKASLAGIAARSRSDVWAVGSVTDATRGQTSRPLIEHWDGKRWRIDLRGNQTGYLLGVAVRASDDAWAVGSDAGSVLIEHWDGLAWRRVIRRGAKAPGVLAAVVALSATDAWAVGYTGTRTALILHWQGQRWQIVQAVTRGATTSLRGVSAVSATDIWAWGATRGADSPPAPFLEHWNGRRWQAAPPPKLDGVGFGAFIALAPNQIWGDVNPSLSSTPFASFDNPVIERLSCSTGRSRRQRNAAGH
jgi:hypothetical protein